MKPCPVVLRRVSIDTILEGRMMVTKVGPMQDTLASGSNPADAQGPGFALTDDNQRPLFVFIFENQAQRDVAAKQLGAILKTAVWAGPAGIRR